MPAPLLILAIIGLSVTLIKATEHLVLSASKIARRLGISEYTISFLLIATATSLPETMVGITSALDKNPILSFGTAIGSNIALLTLIPALPILLGSVIHTRYAIVSKDIYFGSLFAMFPLLLSLDGSLNRIDGIILLIAYVGYTQVVLRRSKGIESLVDIVERTNVVKQFIVFILSLSFVLISSNLIVKLAEVLSNRLGMGLAFIGLTITAIGTSLPEITFSIQAARKHKQGEVLGDIIGSLIVNSTLVLGVTAVIFPIILTSTLINISGIMFMLLSLALFLRIVKTQAKIDKWEAVVMIFIYILFIAGEYFFSSI